MFVISSMFVISLNLLAIIFIFYPNKIWCRIFSLENLSIVALLAVLQNTNAISVINDKVDFVSCYQILVVCT
jgi:hypothetical protein